MRRLWRRWLWRARSLDAVRARSVARFAAWVKRKPKDLRAKSSTGSVTFSEKELAKLKKHAKKRGLRLKIKRVSTPQTLLLDIARSQLGVHEQGKANWGPEVSAYLKAGNISFPAAWCCAFVVWCLEHAGIVNTYGGAYVPHFEAWAKKLNRWHRTDPQPGDLVVFEFNGDTTSDHIGIVESVTRDGVVTIEGNTSSGIAGSQDDGDGVYRRHRPYRLCKGYIRVAP